MAHGKPPQTRIGIGWPVYERKVGAGELPPRAAVVAPLTGAAPTGFGDRKPVRVTASGLDHLLGLDVVYAGKVKNRIGGGADTLAVSVKLTKRPKDWPAEILAGIPETAKLYAALHGLYALKQKFETLVGRPAEGELRAILDDPDRAKKVLGDLTAANVGPASECN